jgi:hypothetical protein
MRAGLPHGIEVQAVANLKLYVATTNANESAIAKRIYYAALRTRHAFTRMPQKTVSAWVSW